MTAAPFVPAELDGGNTGDQNQKVHHDEGLTGFPSKEEVNHWKETHVPEK